VDARVSASGLSGEPESPSAWAGRRATGARMKGDADETLDTGSVYDVQFTDPNKERAFGVAYTPVC
jgi:hypothetical protein